MKLLYRKKKPPSLVTNKGKEQIQATLIFKKAKHYKWLNWFLKDGFSHVRVVIHKPGYWIHIDPRAGVVGMECYPNSDILLKSDGETHVRVNRLVDSTRIRRTFGPLNCVETVKSFIGLSKPFIFTPYQLYKEVMKNG